MIRVCYRTYLLIVLEHVRPKQPLRLDVARETKEEVMEVLVFGFRPHVIQSLFGKVQILGLTQRATLQIKRGISESKIVTTNRFSHIAAMREVGVFPASLMPLTNSHCSLPPCLTTIP